MNREPIAVLANVWANLEALEAVLEYVARFDIPPARVFCLGNLVGYGPDPIACIDRARGFGVVVSGQYDHAASTGDMELWSAHAARRSVEWVRRLLGEESNAGRRHWLQDLAITARSGGMLFLHGTPHRPQHGVLQDPRKRFPGDDPPGLDLIERGPCFHADAYARPAVLDASGLHEVADPPPSLMARILPSRRRSRRETGPVGRPYDLRLSRASLVNVGSVGQPRDQDPRACVAIVGAGLVRWHRVEYDVEATCRKILATPELAPFFADRLRRGR